MKNIGKRLLSLAMVLALMAGMLPGSPLRARAEGDDYTVSADTELVAQQTPDGNESADAPDENEPALTPDGNESADAPDAGETAESGTENAGQEPPTLLEMIEQMNAEKNAESEAEGSKPTTLNEMVEEMSKGEPTGEVPPLTELVETKRLGATRATRSLGATMLGSAPASGEAGSETFTTVTSREVYNGNFTGEKTSIFYDMCAWYGLILQGTSSGWSNNALALTFKANDSQTIITKVELTVHSSGGNAPSGKYSVTSGNIAASGIPTVINNVKANSVTLSTNGADVVYNKVTIYYAAPHSLSWARSEDGASIIATCSNDGCTLTDSTATLTISAPANLTADGTPKPATLNEGYDTTVFPDTYTTITYEKDGAAFDGTPTEPGNYTASVTVGEGEDALTASVSYTLTGVASVTSGETTTEHTSLADAIAAWTDGSTLTLLSDVETASTITVSSGSKTLDLNGHGIRMTGSGSVFSVPSGAALTLNDSDPNAEHKFTVANPYSNGAGLAAVDDVNGTQSFTGGYITGGSTASSNCGAAFTVGGTLNMYAGTIIGNKDTQNNGSDCGVKLTGTFTMFGGRICYNEGNANTGAIDVLNGRFTMNGGSIDHNVARSGGGIFVANSTVSICGGSIVNNGVRKGGNINPDGAGICLKSGTLTISGSPEIRDNYNITNNAADNIRIRSGQMIMIDAMLTNTVPIGVTMSDGSGVFTNSSDISLNDASKFVSDNAGYEVHQTASGQLELRVPPVASVTIGETTKEYTDFAAAVSAWSGAATGSTLQLLADVEWNSGNIEERNSKILDLNGYGIRLGSSAGMIRVNSSLKIIDSNKDQEHKFSISDHIAALDETNGTIIVHGGYITGGRSMWGSAVQVHGGTTLEITGGTIIGNGASNSAAAIHAEQSAIVKMSGGQIIYNYGGIHRENDLSRLEFSGDAVVQNNVDSTGNNPRNVILKGTPLFVTGSLGDNASIGITMNNPGVFTNSANTSLNDASKFVSDNAAYEVHQTSSGQLELRVPPVASVTSGGTTTEYAAFADAVSAWNSASSGATLTLLGDVTTSSTITVSGTKTLDLNGCGIRMTGSGSVFSVTGSLTINDSSPNAAHKFTVASPATNGAGLATVNDALTSDYQTFTGGYITGGSAAHGGGILVQAGGCLTMNGGTIIGNQSSNMGAGIKITMAGDNTTSPATMNGGAIMYNKVTGYGAGVCSDGGFTMTGGTISHNYATVHPGGIHCHYLYLSGGRIENNYCGDAGFAAGAHADTQIYLSGAPVVSGNVANGIASNLDWDRPDNVKNTKLSITDALTEGAEIGVTLRVGGTGVFTSSTNTSLNDASKFVSDYAGYEVHQTADGQLELRVPPAAEVDGTGYGTFAAAVSAWNSAASGATLKLCSDVTTASTVSVSGTKTLDLNGCGVKMTGSGSVFSVTGSLTINDSSPNAAHKFKVADPAKNGAGLATVDDTLTSGYQTFTGGYITGGNTNEGGALYIYGGSVTLNGGTLIGNKANANGGAVRLLGGAKYTMDGGAILHNGMNSFGGAISLGSGTFTLKRGTISHNRSTGNGGAIHTDGSSNTVIISGGSIINNHTNGSDSTYKGGGVIRANGTALQISGNPVISGNTSGSSETADNVFLLSGETITVTGALTNTAPIGVTVQGGAGVFTSGDATCNDVSKFTSDNAGYVVGKNAAGQLLVATPVTVTFDANGHGTAPTAQSVASGGVVTEPDAPTDADNNFDGWYKESTCATAWSFASDAVTGNTTLYAKWTPKAHTLTFDTDGGSTLDPITAAHGAAVTLSEAPLRTDYNFAGWNTAADGTGTPYADGASVTLTGDLTLYAQWSAKPLNTVSGTVQQGGAAAGGVTVRLVQGEKNVAVTQTDASGAYSFSAPEGTYNIVAELDGKTKTNLVTLDAAQTLDLALPTENVSSVLNVSGGVAQNVMVGGLDAVAEAAAEAGSTVTLTMTVEEKATSVAANASAIQSIAATQEHPNQTLDCFDISLQKTVDGGAAQPVPEDKARVVEIIIPYKFTGKEYVAVYRYHGSAEPLTVLSSRPTGSYQDCTCYLDKANGVVYIYADKFSTYAIGYTQCYNIAGALHYGSYSGSVTVTLADSGGAAVQQQTATMTDGEGVYSFTHIPEGQYSLKQEWSEDGKQNSLELPLSVQ